MACLLRGNTRATQKREWKRELQVAAPGSHARYVEQNEAAQQEHEVEQVQIRDARHFIDKAESDGHEPAAAKVVTSSNTTFFSQTNLKQFSINSRVKFKHPGMQQLDGPSEGVAVQTESGGR
jgi:hypothetical protein